MKRIISILSILSGTCFTSFSALADQERPWRAPDFTQSKGTLGYSDQAFATPKGMEKHVQFWVDVYTKYSTQQGIIHDSENVEKVYEVVDLSAYPTDHAKQKHVDQIKKRIVEKFKLSSEEEARLRYQLGQSDRMQDAIFFSGRYLEQMEEIFKKANLPVELTRLVFVESSFNVFARSKVGASGVWQIMPYTARPYRMISTHVDKRNDPIEATKVAAKLLKQNYRMLEAWPLAVTGYNHGPTGVRKITQTYNTRELGELILNVKSRQSFGFASRNFYASFLAALEVEKNADKYFKNLKWAHRLPAQEIVLPKATRYRDVVRWFGGDDKKAQLFNPHLTVKARKGTVPAKTRVAVPHDKHSEIVASFKKGGRQVAMEEKAN